jgi:copper chaperone CopZ
MTCSGCEAHIENAFSELEDIASVKADYLKGMAVVGHH